MNLHRDGPAVIAIDAGTGSVRALAFDCDGVLLAQSSREWHHKTVSGHPGGVDFDTTTGWTLICDCLRDVVGLLGNRDILAVSTSSMREGFVLYDDEGREIFACPNTDGRAISQADELVRSGMADEIYRRGGDWVSITAPARLLWLRDHAPDVLARVRHLGMISDWVTFRLTGQFVTDPTCGSSSALFDLPSRTWARDLVEACHLSADVLPELLEPGTIAGRVTRIASAVTGLTAGTPVVVGGADTQLALHGLGATKANATVIAGTFWQTTTLTNTALIDPQRRLRTLCAVDPEQWMVEGIGFLSGLSLRWFRDAFCPDAVKTAAETGQTAYTVMESWANEVPVGSHGILALLSNVMQADAWHHTSPAIVQLDISSPEKSNRASVIRAIEEAAAYVTRAHLEILDELSGGSLAAAGEFTLAGGSSVGKLWPQIIASVVGMPVLLSQTPEATAYGAARLAAAGVGVAMEPASHHSRRIEPIAEDHLKYNTLYSRWSQAYSAYSAAGKEASMTPLFTPPGALS